MVCFAEKLDPIAVEAINPLSPKPAGFDGITEFSELTELGKTGRPFDNDYKDGGRHAFNSRPILIIIIIIIQTPLSAHSVNSENSVFR